MRIRPHIQSVWQAPRKVIRFPLSAKAGAGMTLLEVLIASAILVFGMVGILAMFNAAARTHKRAVDETTATMVGTSVMSELRGLLARGIVPTETKKAGKKGWKIDDLPEHQDYPGYHYAVRVVDLNPRRKFRDKAVFGKDYYVEVQVFWSDRGDNKSVQFETVMFMRSK